MTRVIDLAEFQLGVLVETGTGLGDRVIEAMRLGFPAIHSIELFHDVFSVAHGRIQQAASISPTPSRIMLYQGDSVTSLPAICASVKAGMVDAISGMIVFWLDARPFRLPDGQLLAGSTPYPLLEELRIIRTMFRDSLWTPVILINGISESLAGIQASGMEITLSSVKEIIYSIEAEYSIETVRIASTISEGLPETEDVLIAFPAWFVESRRQYTQPDP
ncbi:hypothetical protein [Niveispirillum sp. BGYR6]|uniref:hypothetical protein n=1 Tax=Niveispirillum sp. BGYR6 TaxID=2971249 RepID=UPI0022B9D45C|nr:hypothetical protein [Niveispirillum sp. BGYR6]MDG5497466.1 hypothetical protein [Niveispirillum sp. BGYR6]